MEVKLLHREEEPLLSRTRLEGEVVFDKATPSIKEVRSNIAKSLGKDEELVYVEGVYNKYGQKKARLVCYAYEDKDVLRRVKVEGKKAKEKAAKAQEKTGAGEKGKEPEKKEGKKEAPPEKKEEKKEEAEDKAKEAKKKQ